MQYTLRQIPKQVDKALRAKAKAEGKSLNQAAVDVLKAGLGVSDEPGKKRDLSDLAGSMSPEEARTIEEAHDWFDRVWAEEQSK
jgi:plasmid stability protein